MSKKKPAAIDLSDLEQAGKEHDHQRKAALEERQREYDRMRRREEAAWPLLTLLTRLAQHGREPFDRTGELVDAFFGVCEVMREQGLGPELETLDEDRMAIHYGDRWPQLAHNAYDAAAKALREGITNGRSRPLERQLTRVKGHEPSRG